MKDFFSRLTWVDYITFIAVLRGCYAGYRSGVFPELLRVAAYAVTVIVTFQFHEAAAQYLTVKTFLNLTSATAVSFFALLVGVFVITKLVTVIILKLMKVGQGGFFYRLTGLVIGACRWVILLSLVFMLIDYSPLSPLKTDIHDRSVVGPKVSAIGPMMFEFLSTLSPQIGASPSRST